MNKILKPGQAGTIESNDVMVTVAPGERGAGIVIELVSPVMKQYGKQIKKVISETIKELDITDVVIMANDKGALDCTIQARVKTAVERALA